MLHHFRLYPFLAGLAVGVLLIVFYKAAPIVVYNYPHPQNVRDRVYRDTNGVCYKYNAQEVECDENEGTLKMYPIQSGA